MAEQTTDKVPWYAHEAVDDTWRLFGGLFVFTLAMVGIFIAEMSVGNIANPIYLKEGIVHAIFGYITGWISGGGRKKTTNGRS